MIRNMRRHLAGCAAAVLISGALLATGAMAQTRPRHRPAGAKAPPRAASEVAASQAQTKGIWEPVNYSEDLKFLDVFFVTADEGWVVGGRGENSGGIILHTSDGGAHWDNQYGDPGSSDGGISHVRFLDATHGWAMQWTGQAARLLHTRDGKNWILSGTIPEHTPDYMFTSEATGVAIDGGRLLQTTDGGRRWLPVNQCEISVQVEGLAHRANCTWMRVQFLTPSVGYATGFSVVGVGSGPARKFVVIGKTVDGGASWALTPSEVTEDTHDAFFIDENTGYIRVGYPDTGQLYKTTDGGQTWTGMAASPGDRMQFADPEVGWSLHYNKVSFTTNGGDRWNSREYPFPAHVETFSLPRRDRGYIVGEHGMIYRYRLVPADYTAKGMIPAPLLSGIDSSLEKQVEQLAAQVQGLATDAGAPPAANSGAANAAPAPTGAEPAGGAGAGETAAQPGAGNDLGGGFTQDVGQAEQTTEAMSAEVPQFVSKYRNLNLLLAGFQMATQMPAQVQDLKQSFLALKQVRDPQAASAALVDVQTKVQGLVQMVRMAFQKK